MNAPRPQRPDGPAQHNLLEAAHENCPQPLHLLLAGLVRTLALHDERITRLEETQEIKELLP